MAWTAETGRARLPGPGRPVPVVAALGVLLLLAPITTAGAAAGTTGDAGRGARITYETKCSGMGGCRRNLFAVAPDGTHRPLGVGYAGRDPVLSEDSSRCVFFGSLEKSLIPDGRREVEAVWWVDAEGHAKRTRDGSDYEIGWSSVLPKPDAAGVFLYTRQDPADDWTHAATVWGEDTLWALLGGTPAHRVAALGGPDELQALMSRGDSLGSRNLMGLTPLELAVLAGNEPVAARLASLADSVVGDRTSAMKWAVLFGLMETLDSLGRSGFAADDTTQRQLLELAVLEHKTTRRSVIREKLFRFPRAHTNPVPIERQVACLEWLLRFGCDVRARDGHGRAPLHAAAGAYIPAVAKRAERREEAVLRRDLVRVLLDHGADPNARDHRGWTPLHEVVFPEYPEIAEPVIRLLVERGADVNATNAEGLTPLQLLFWFHGDQARAKFGSASVRGPDGATFRIAAVLAACGARLDLPEEDRREVEARARKLPRTTAAH